MTRRQSGKGYYRTGVTLGKREMYLVLDALLKQKTGQAYGAMSPKAET